MRMPWVVNSWLLHTYASGESNFLFHTIYKMQPVALRRSSLPFCLCTFQFFHYSCQLMAYAYAHTTLFLYVNQIVLSGPEKVWKSKNYMMGIEINYCSHDSKIYICIPSSGTNFLHIWLDHISTCTSILSLARGLISHPTVNQVPTEG